MRKLSTQKKKKIQNFSIKHKCQGLKMQNGVISFERMLPNQSWVLSNVLNKGQVLNSSVYYAKINGIIHHPFALSEQL